MKKRGAYCVLHMGLKITPEGLELDDDTFGHSLEDLDAWAADVLYRRHLLEKETRGDKPPLPERDDEFGFL